MRTVIIDCDGVIYPASEMTIDIQGSMNGAADNLGIPREKLEHGTRIARSAGKKGIFNFVYEAVDHDKGMLDKFFEEMTKFNKYDGIEYDEELLRMINEVSKFYNVVVLSNNHRVHIEKVLEKKFHRSIKTFGFECYDLEWSFRDGTYYPKQSDVGLRMFAEFIGMPPEDCILIDDSRPNIETARDNGMTGHLINKHNTLKQVLRNLCKRKQK